MIWFFYHVVVPCWDCFTETVLIGVCVCGGGGGVTTYFSHWKIISELFLFFLLVGGPAFLL